jgi:hypothetical protein
MAAPEMVVNCIRNEYDSVRNRCGGAMKSDDEWVNLVKGILRAEMTRRGMTYEKLAEKLAELGVNDTDVNIRNKVARGGFSAVFFVQCLKAVGCNTLRLEAD